MKDNNKYKNNNNNCHLSCNSSIYREASLLVREIAQINVKMSKQFRVTMGDRLLNLSMDILNYITMANINVDNLPERLKLIKQIQANVQLIDTILNVYVDISGKIDSNIEASIAVRLVTVGKQSTGWKHSTQDAIDRMMNQ